MLQFVALNAITKYVTTELMIHQGNATYVNRSSAVYVDLVNLFPALAVRIAFAVIASRLGKSANVVKAAAAPALSVTRVVAIIWRGAC